MRMKSVIWLGVLAMFAVSLGACEQEDTTLEEGDPAEISPATQDEDTLDEDSPLSEQEQRRTAEELALRTESLPGAGAYVTDGSGQALYILEGEDDPSACVDACEEEWPPFAVTSGEPTAQGEELQEDLIGTVERPDGTMQITYDGHPLYFYHDDQGPGDTRGQHVEDQWGEWYLLSPEGETVEEGTEQQEQTGDEPEDAQEAEQP